MKNQNNDGEHAGLRGCEANFLPVSAARAPHHLRLRQNYFFAAQTEIYLPDEFDEGAKRHKLEARCFGIKANVLAAIKVRADGAEEEASTILGGI
jgi:hypothetical protein